MKNRMMDWCSAKLFSYVHSNNLVYNTCWEDPAIDRQALDIKSSDKIMMITSAGCNALDYALMAPERICAVDINPRQNALLDLKIAGIKNLDFETFFEIFGRGRLQNFASVYHLRLRPSLSPFSQAHWDKNLNYFAAPDTQRGFYFRGTSGGMARLINHYIDLTKGRAAFEKLLSAKSVAEQSQIYHSQLKDLLWNKFVRFAISTDASLSMIGVPRPQRQQVETNYTGGIAKFIEDCVEYVLTQIPLESNYFWSLYLTGEYTADRCPEYLKRSNFEKLKSGLVDSISFYNSSIADFLKNSGDRFTKFVLLDHMDWLSTYNRPMLQNEWQQIANSVAPQARLIWRSGGMNTDFVNQTNVKTRSGSAKVGDLLNFHRDWAAQLHKFDRVHTYGSFYIADFAAPAL